MNARHAREVRRSDASRLLSIESPVAEEGRIRRIAEIEDKDVVSTSPPGRSVVASPANDVGDARIAFPPTLVRPGQRPWLSRLRADHRIASRNGANAHGIAWVRHVPDLVCGAPVAPQHVDLAVVDGKAAAVADPHHLRSTPAAIGTGMWMTYFGCRGLVTSTIEVPFS